MAKDVALNFRPDLKPHEIIEVASQTLVGVPVGVCATQYIPSEEKETPAKIMSIVVGKTSYTPEANNIDSNTAFSIASLTKLFTAATILRMLETEPYCSYFPNGINTKISETALPQYFPECPLAKSDITLLELLTHKHRIGDHLQGTPFEQNIHDKNLTVPLHELLKIKPTPVSLEVKSDHNYSNMGYLLLGGIIEATAKKATNTAITYDKMVREMVLNPLNLTHTLMPSEVAKASTTHGSTLTTEGKPIHAMPERYASSHGGMYSSADDYAKFTHAFFTEQLFQRPLQECVMDGWGAGFFVEYNSEKEPIAYEINGGMIGCSAYARFDISSKKATCAISVVEDISMHKAWQAMQHAEPSLVGITLEQVRRDWHPFFPQHPGPLLEAAACLQKQYPNPEMLAALTPEKVLAVEGVSALLQPVITHNKAQKPFRLEAGLSLALKSLTVQESEQFLETGKLRKELPIGHVLDISPEGRYYGTVRADGSRLHGILIGPAFGKKEAVFIGKFDEKNDPYAGEFRLPGMIVTRKPALDGSLALTQREWEGGQTKEFISPDGEMSNLQFHRVVDLSGDIGTYTQGKSTGKQVFNKEEISPHTIRLPKQVSGVYEQFESTQGEFDNLRKSQEPHYQELLSGLEEKESKTHPALLEIRTALKDRTLPIGSTMYLELNGIKTPEEQRTYAQLERGMGLSRKKAEPAEGEPSVESLAGFGNCREYGLQTQRIAIENGLPYTFTVVGSPDHVFNVAVDSQGKMVHIDGWNGDLMTSFDAEHFYQHASLHALYDLKIHQDSFLQNKNGYPGLLDQEDLGVREAASLLEKQIQAIHEARFEPTTQKIITERVAKKLEALDPNDGYYHANSRELQALIGHFGLPTQMQEQMQEQYVIRFDAAKLIVGNEAFVVYDLFCRDHPKPYENFVRITEQMFAKIQEKAGEFNEPEKARANALVEGFQAMYAREFSEMDMPVCVLNTHKTLERLSHKTSLKSLNIDALDPKLQRASTLIERIEDTPTKSWVEKTQNAPDNKQKGWAKDV